MITPHYVLFQLKLCKLLRGSINDLSGSHFPFIVMKAQSDVVSLNQLSVDYVTRLTTPRRQSGDFDGFCILSVWG